MKKISNLALAMIALLAVLFASLPLNVVQAKEAADVDLKIRNRTGFSVSLTLYDQEGYPRFFTFEPGQTVITIPEGKFTYYAVTKCGVKSGSFNLNVTKELFLSCGEGAQLTLQVPVGPAPACTTYAWWHSGDGWGHWHSYEDGPEGEDPEYELLCADGVDIESEK